MFGVLSLFDDKYTTEMFNNKEIEIHHIKSLKDCNHNIIDDVKYLFSIGNLQLLTKEEHKEIHNN